MAAPSSVKQSGPFADYPLGDAWDEMFADGGDPRPHCQQLYRTLLQLPADELRRRKSAADLAFLHQGITFTVYGREEGTERIFPHDPLPRIIPLSEWRQIE